MMMFIYYIVSVVILFYSGYWLITVIVGLLPSKNNLRGVNANLSTSPNHLIILPAYRPDGTFLKALESLEYERLTGSHVYILFQQASLEIVEKVRLLYPNYSIEERRFDHLDGNSYQHALRYISGKIKRSNQKYEYIMILDKDNIVQPGFFQRMISAARLGYDLIQSRRAAIKIENSMQVFDTLSEHLNDIMFRSFRSKMGFVPEISGSGAMVRTNIFLKCIDELDPKAPGFDKNFMINLLIWFPKTQSIYLKDAVLLEEKTKSNQVHKNQRIRWFGEQYYNVWFNGGRLMYQVLKFNFSALDYLIILSRPPRSVFMAVVALLGTMDLLIWGLAWVSTPLLFIGFLMTSLSLGLAMLSSGMGFRSILYLGSFPKLVLYNIKSSFSSMKKENRGIFIHTERDTKQIVASKT